VLTVSVTEERILVCMDDGARRRLFRAALSAAPGIEVVGSATADTAAVRAAAARQPDLVLLEARRPAVEGAKLIGRLRSVAPLAGVIAIAAAGDRPRSIAARSLTADRYVDPDAAITAVLHIVVGFAREHRSGLAAS
jgi:DNA-binding NarL/FixJ family response regulator